MSNTRFFRSLLAASCCAAIFSAGCAGPSASAPREKIKITKLDELPQHTYQIPDKPSAIVKQSKPIAELAAAVRADVESDLQTYDIGDATTLQRMHSTLLTVDLVNRDYAAALARIEQIERLEDKEAARLTTGLTTKAMIAAYREVGSAADFSAYHNAFRRHFAAQINDLPWNVVQDIIQERKGSMEIFSENLLMGILNANMDVAYQKTGELSADQARGLIGMYITLTERLPLKNEMIDVYQEYIDAHKTVKPDIWRDRSVTLTTDQNLTPVVMAPWDSGTDPDVFSDRLFVNLNEQVNGKDDDNNGYVDDLHGIAFDIHANRTTGMLCPLEDAADRMPQIMKHIKGFMDLQAAVDSPEATAVKQHLSTLQPGDVKGFIEDLSLAGNYAHGTHVAGIMIEGNPSAQVLIARLSYDHRMTPVARTVEWGKRDGQKCRDTAEYFKEHGVRVVNMSWGEALEDAEDSLERNGVGESAEERREIARKVFARQKEGLYEGIKNAPEVLFIGAAGNADNDVEFDDYIPSCFELPNLLIVGAVDQAGEPTSFTSSGRTVQVYANGFEVDSFVPGGERMKMSGTSMASPNVANLAGKILAVDPTLTPPEVIALIKKGADKKESGGMTYLLINPRRTIDLLKSS